MTRAGIATGAAAITVLGGVAAMSRDVASAVNDVRNAVPRDEHVRIVKETEAEYSAIVMRIATTMRACPAEE